MPRNLSGGDRGYRRRRIHPHGFVDTSAELDSSIETISRVMSQLMELAEVEKATQLLAVEIEKTRRRVNALNMY